MAFRMSSFVRFGLMAAMTGGTLAACVSQSSYAQLDAAHPIGSAFSQALFKDYAYLARSFGPDAGLSDTTFDAANSIPLTSFASDVTDLANAFADKAIVAGRGEEVVVEPAPEGDVAAQEIRLRVLKDVDAARDKVPEDSARAQTDYDCWIMNARVDSQKASSLQCRRSLDGILAALERETPAPAAAPPPAPDASANPGASAPDATPAPAAQTPAPAPAASPAAAPAAPPATETALPPPQPAAPTGPQYTVYFAVNSSALTSEDIAVIGHAIDDARRGGEGHIVIVGYADRAGAESRVQKLSEDRAGAVRDLMMQMGARYEAIQVSGAGDKNLAVNSRKGVKEPQNRRAIVTLAP
jgi:outer membrane protein OmpA-like peptidoglycan-associated protein